MPFEFMPVAAKMQRTRTGRAHLIPREAPGAVHSMRTSAVPTRKRRVAIATLSATCPISRRHSETNSLGSCSGVTESLRVKKPTSRPADTSRRTLLVD